MKNIRVYDCFLNNIQQSFRIRYLKISLSRTLVFNFDDDDTIYYRKKSISRKISLVGRERIFLLKSKMKFERIDHTRKDIINISNILSEYIYRGYLSNGVEQKCVDVVEKNRNKIFTPDSIIRKVCRDEIVTMCFETGKQKEKFNKILLANNMEKNNYKSEKSAFLNISS